MPDLKISIGSVPVDIFNWLRRKNVFPENMDRRSMIWLIWLHSFYGENFCGKILDGKFNNAKIYGEIYMKSRVSEMKKLLL